MAALQQDDVHSTGDSTLKLVPTMPGNKMDPQDYSGGVQHDDDDDEQGFVS